MNLIGKLCQLRPTLRGYRNLYLTHVKNAYEGPGKTTVTFISKEIGSRIYVNRCDQMGFTLSTGTKVLGPTVLFPRHAICWNIQSGKHINEASLSLFTVLEPKPDLLIIGLDDQYDFAYMKNLRECVHKLGINTEIISVYNACTVFNFVNEEGRFVVAALIPQKAPKRLLKLPESKPAKQITDSGSAENSKTDNAKTESTRNR
ncbi:PREDICTED: NADH dehydrogenase [ubiquinone] 1 alpha subcomplex assembly factor 3 [Acromyrmex echinatior]|uniref:NADH dehydrogenase [ubiquinone] 1 alpha subcomplex assembly factor 3 n=1 Tax=Acromyrmex echinatior TaxID=103372 RepID=F4WWD3_ACREC|nr:PREDICTED: NADH dehydrogenase [ubiquinone] 1 alpha subcomplex assembly factor 3 [Acromyrmex echinatior]EGI61475.1 NADH dehydrogenase [ubiquinone] 1 alpha subcomplex assembly factor 3 [Acromyrmex echinatior]